MMARLFLLAHGRSGDKGDAANVGVIARREEWYAFIKKELTARRVAEFLKPLADGPVERYELDNLGALNFVVHRALGGGGSESLRLDAQGKTYAQAVLRMPVKIEGKLQREVKAHWGKGLPGDCVLSNNPSTTQPVRKTTRLRRVSGTKKLGTPKKRGSSKLSPGKRSRKTSKKNKR